VSGLRMKQLRSSCEIRSREPNGAPAAAYWTLG
jgi:hypothetical protein